MAGLFGGGPKGGSSQPPVIPPPAPVRDDVAATASGERQRLAALRGRSSTLLGGPGSYSPAPAAQRTLLGVD